MEILKIERGNVSATINTYGGSLDGIIVNGKQTLWQNDGRWPNLAVKLGAPNQPAPILFPICGSLRVLENGMTGYVYKDTFYPMKQHGIARINTFSVIDKAKDYCHLQLTSSDELKRIYPFDFTLEVLYEIVKDGIKITYIVTNTGDSIMPYNIGDHPAFAIGKSIEHYSLQFESDTVNELSVLAQESKKELSSNRDIIHLQQEWLKDNKTVQIIGINSGKCRLLEDEIPIVEYDIDNTVFWLWSTALPTLEKSGFICIEPLNGDEYLFNDMNNNIKNGKILTLEAGESRSLQRIMTFPSSSTQER